MFNLTPPYSVKEMASLSVCLKLKFQPSISPPLTPISFYLFKNIFKMITYAWVLPLQIQDGILRLHETSHNERLIRTKTATTKTTLFNLNLTVIVTLPYTLASFVS